MDQKVVEKNKILINKLQEGNEKVWRELINKYSDKLFGYALSLSFDHSIASDIVQQVFISFYEYRYKLKPQYSMESFLYKSVYNKFITEYHKNKSLTRLHEQYYFILEQQLINKLPEKTKMIFSLKKKHGLTNQEIAEYNKISLKTVEAHITKAFKLLRSMAEKIKE